ncbi:hypothetical protein OG618_27405 [Kitasatospora sp. NBC_01246]|uniref:hypothetical protein n=1 Tax=Kitasatospora sp. NBC_01246 TaxID=2903570 RepID=UPI002E34EDC3|nr:hypothetical protein [Kitasatospora sp. NBC_01246]
MRKWRKAGVFGVQAVESAQALLHELTAQADPAMAGWALDAFRSALNGEPSAQLLPAVRAVLADASPELVAEALTTIHAAGFTWLSDSGALRLAVLSDSAGLPAGSASPPAEEDPWGAFALLATLAGNRLPELSPQTLSRLLPWIPLGIMDDLIDAQILSSAHEPWQYRTDEHESAYLMARLVPHQVTDTQAEKIQWLEKLHRDAFLSGTDTQPPSSGLYDLLGRVADGETSALKYLEQLLPRELVLLLRRIQGGALTGTWERDIVDDRGLWRLIFALWEPKAAVNPARSPLHALMALRRAYDLICSGDIQHAGSQIGKLVAFEAAEPEYLAEVFNLQAYLLLLEEKLDAAVIALSRIRKIHPRAAANLALIERRRTVPRNDRRPASNPYLDLGLPHTSSMWETRYRDLRREFARDVHMSARLNRAMKSIREAEQEENWSDFFVLPLDADLLRLPDTTPVSLVPPLAPLERRTIACSPADLELVRRRAITDLLPTLLNAPRRPDHHHRTIT